MRKDWEYKKLGEVGTIITGSTPSTKDNSNYLPQEYCFVKPSDLIEQGICKITKTEFYLSKKGFSISRALPIGSVLVSCIGSIGKIGVLTKEACSNQQINAIIPSNNIDSFYLAYVLCGIKYKLEEIANAPVVPIINKTAFSKVIIPIPPKPTQLAIVAELDKINELIQLKKQQLEDYDQLAQSIFYEMFGDPVENEKGWEVKKLGEVCEVTSSKRIFADDYVEKGIPFYRSKEVIEKSKNLPISVELFITEEKYNNINKSYGVPQIDDILITAVGTIGKIWKVNTIEPFYFKDGNIIWIRKYNEINSTYFKDSLYYLIDEFKKVNANGAAYNALTIIKLKQMQVPLPPLPLQQQFAARIEAIERQKQQVSETIKDLETLLASRMQYWFD